MPTTNINRTMTITPALTTEPEGGEGNSEVPNGTPNFTPQGSGSGTGTGTSP
jgi:hypothetical protein